MSLVHIRLLACSEEDLKEEFEFESYGDIVRYAQQVKTHRQTMIREMVANKVAQCR